MSRDPYAAGPYGTNFDTGVSHGMSYADFVDRKKARHRQWLAMKAKGKEQAGEPAASPPSPLEAERALQRRVIHCHSLNPEMCMKSLGGRFGITAQKAKRLIRDGPSFPKRYKIAARRLRPQFPELTPDQVLELVTAEKEKGNQWCSLCRSWDEVEAFSEGSSVTRRHKSTACTPKKTKG